MIAEAPNVPERYVSRECRPAQADVGQRDQRHTARLSQLVSPHSKHGGPFRRPYGCIRLALGASAGALKGMFVRNGLLLVAVGVASGLAVAAGLTRVMTSFLFGISPLDPTTYAAVGLVLAVAAALGSYVPARRAAAVDPILVLRSE